MKFTCLALLSIALPVCAQVRIPQSNDRISVDIDGKPFTSL